MPYVVSLTEADWAEIRVIVMDQDGKAALDFLKTKVVKAIELSQNKSLDVSKGHV
ncbi:MAG: hypothetical protein HY900_21625 [Deltaproteobacteria bacterium]|nr:hypothetical protein [Deltaproteobacteria bacterium]